MRHTHDMPSTVQEPERRTRRDRRNPACALGAELPGAFARGEIEVLFQPQFCCRDGTVTGAEALARWRHPAKGSIGAGALFDIAGRAGQVEPLSRHIAAAALGVACGWPAALHLSLNVTAADLAAADFEQNLTDTLARAGFPAQRLTVEITEQSLVAELDRCALQLRRLAGLGIRIALDDFGAGFCNFSYLKRLPLHSLKLDRSMIEGVAESASDLAVLRGIVAMASALGLAVVAEGIEREDQRAIVVAEGCTAWQGFLGSEPISAAEFSVSYGADPLSA
jgi:EAL domain-containing protein (putative c-di-GMP-specific phosphodiesterase class I)